MPYLLPNESSAIFSLFKSQIFINNIYIYTNHIVIRVSNIRPTESNLYLPLCCNVTRCTFKRMYTTYDGARRSSEVERSLMVRWVVGSILHRVDLLSYFSFQPVLHDWCNKGRGMCYPVCGMVHIKEPLLLIDKSSLCGGSGFPFSLSEWSLTICLTPYNRR